MNPLLVTWAWKIGGVLIICAGLMWGFHSWKESIYQEGYNTAQAEAHAREEAATLAAVAAQKQREENEQVRDRELRLSFDTMLKKRYEEGMQNAIRLNTIRASARDGSLRLSIDAALSPSISDGTGKGITDASPGLEQGTRINVLPRIADDILRIAGNSADDVRAYNELLKHYHALENRCRPD